MSAIQKELSKVTEIEPKRNEDRQDFIVRLMKGVSDLSDDEWEGLSKEAQDWFNDAADAKNAKKKVLPDFPDAEAEEPADEKPTTGRRGSKKEEPAMTKVGDTATIVTKRGKTVVGKVVEIDKEVVVLDVDGEETEFDRERLESITVKHGNAKDEEADEEEDPIKVGAKVTVTTKRGKEATGTIVEIDAEVVVLDVDGEDQEFARDRVESIKPVKAKAAAVKDEEPAKTSRRGAAKEEPAEEAPAKPKRASNGEVSVGTRIKELIADNPDATEADLAKMLKKEGLEFRDNTLKLNYADCHKFLAILRDRKLLKK